MLAVSFRVIFYFRINFCFNFQLLIVFSENVTILHKYDCRMIFGVIQAPTPGLAIF